MTAKVTAAAKPKKAPAPAKARATTTKAKTATKKTTTKAKSAKPAAKHAVPDAHQLHLAHLAHLKAEGKSGFAVGDLLPVCSAQALAQSLRLAGQRVSDDEVLELHYRAGGSADEMVSVGEALAAAARFGLAGVRPVDIRRLGQVEQARELAAVGHAAVDELLSEQVIADFGDDLAELHFGDRVGGHLLGREAAQFEALADFVAKCSLAHALILHVDVPGPHAVLATRDGWWSWGELFSPWPARVSEAWAVSWS